MYYPARHTRMLRRALAAARLSTERQRHGVVIARGNRVVAVGVNAPRNSPLICSDPEREAATHAEIAAIRALPQDTDYSRLTLYSGRLMRNGTAGLAKPCVNCAEVLDRLGFKDVIYT